MKQSQFQFNNPRIIRTDFRVNQKFDVNKDTEQGFCIGTETKVSISEDSKEARVILEVNIPKTPQSATELNLPFSCRVWVMADFSWGEEMDNIAVQPFLKINAPALLLSYARTMVAQLTMQAGFPAFHIPFIDFRE